MERRSGNPKKVKNPAGGLCRLPHAGQKRLLTGWPQCQHSEKEAFISRRKAGSTSAALLGVRILELETGVHQRIFPVQGHSVQVDQALRVDEDIDILELKH